MSRVTPRSLPVIAMQALGEDDARESGLASSLLQGMNEVVINIGGWAG